MDILELLLNGDPAAEQKRAADLLRGKQQFQDMAQGADQQAHKLDLLNFVSQNANNPALGKSMAALAQNQQGRYGLQKLDKGVYSPATGAYQESPGAADEKEADRENRRLQAAALYQSRKEAADTAAEARRYAADQGLEGRKLMQTLLALRQQDKTDAKAGEAATKADKILQDRVTKFAGTVDKEGVAEFDQSLKIAEGRLGKHKLGELPGYGRFEGAVPGWLSTSGMQTSRTDMQQAANVLLHARSGAAVTDGETRRFLTEVATGAGMTEEAMRHGWANVRQTFDAKVKNLQAGVSDEVLSTYSDRGGEPSIGRRSSDRAGGTMRFDKDGNPTQ